MISSGGPDPGRDKVDRSERETIDEIVRVIYHSSGDWRTPGGIARDLKISSETVNRIVKSHPEFFILASDGRAKYALRPAGLDPVSLTENARNRYIQRRTMSS